MSISLNDQTLRHPCLCGLVVSLLNLISTLKGIPQSQCHIYYIYRPQTKFAKVMFLHVSVIQSIEGYPSMPCKVVSQHALQVSRGVSMPTPEGGVSRPTPRGRVSRPTPGGVCVPACTEADPTCGWLLPRVVQILLERILVEKSFPNIAK